MQCPLKYRPTLSSLMIISLFFPKCMKTGIKGMIKKGGLCVTGIWNTKNFYFFIIIIITILIFFFFFFFFKRNKNGTNILSTQYLIIMIVNGFIEIAALLDLNSCRLYKLMSLISVTLFHTCFYYFVCFFFFFFFFFNLKNLFKKKCACLLF